MFLGDFKRFSDEICDIYSNNLVNWALKVEGKASKRKVLHKQAREPIFKVCEAREANDATCQTVDNVAKCQERTAKSCVGLRTVQRIV